MKPTVNESLLSALVSEGEYGFFGGGSESVKFRHDFFPDESRGAQAWTTIFRGTVLMDCHWMRPPCQSCWELLTFFFLMGGLWKWYRIIKKKKKVKNLEDFFFWMWWLMFLVGWLVVGSSWFLGCWLVGGLVVVCCCCISHASGKVNGLAWDVLLLRGQQLKSIQNIRLVEDIRLTSWYLI